MRRSEINLENNLKEVKEFFGLTVSRDRGYTPVFIDKLNWLIDRAEKAEQLAEEAKLWREIAESCECNND